eukprot:1159390-Pelagomonas_calceolata.AAC.3
MAKHLDLGNKQQTCNLDRKGKGGGNKEAAIERHKHDTYLAGHETQRLCVLQQLTVCFMRRVLGKRVGRRREMPSFKSFQVQNMSEQGHVQAARAFNLHSAHSTAWRCAALQCCVSLEAIGVVPTSMLCEPLWPLSISTSLSSLISSMHMLHVAAHACTSMHPCTAARTPSPIHHGVMDLPNAYRSVLGRPMLVVLQCTCVANDNKGAAGACEADIDAALVCHKADAPAFAALT